MAKDVITRFKLETTQYDSKIKSAAKELSDIAKSAKSAGADFERFTKDSLEAARSLGTIATSSVNAKDRAKELVGAFNDVARSYNQLTEEQKNSDFGKAVADSLTHLQQRIRETKEEMKGIEAGGGGLFGGGKLDGMLQVFGGNLMTKGVELATGAVTSLISETGDMIKQGVELAKQGEGIRIAFERLGRGDILQGLREATHGTVTDLELMKAAVKFNDFKLPLDELGTMLAFAQKKAKDTGQSVDYMVDSIVTGLGRKSLMILDNLGLSATEIRERMKETGDMTKAVGSIIRDQMKNAGDYVETAADRAAQANVSLQNKMEELGRKFAPIEEASNHLWTSMKIGILDIIGGPLATLLNNLTEAGRLRNQLNKMNGDPSTGQPTKVQQQLSTLRGSKYRNANYKGQLAQYDKQIGDLNFKIAAYGGKGKDAIEQGQVQQLKLQRDALKAMRSEYVQGAKDIMKPVEANVKTDKAEQNVKTLTAQLKELEKQRKEAVKKGDQEQVEALTKQISQTKTNLGYLDPSATKGAKAVQDDFTEIIGLIGNAQERVSDLQKRIRESWDQNEITTLNQKLKDAQNELDVLQGKLPKDTVVDITVDAKTAEALKKIGDIDGVTIDTKTMTVTADTTDALQRVQKLVAETNGTIIEMKVVPVIADEDIERSLREQYGKPIEVPITPMTAADKLELEVRTKLSEQNIEADMQTLRTLMEVQIKNGIEGIEIPTGFLIEKIMGEGVPDEYWQNLQDQFNEKLKEMDIDPINIDFETGKEKDKKSNGGPMDDIKKVVSGLNQVASGLQQMGIQLPEGVNQVLGVVNGLMTIIQGISTIIGITQFAAITANTISLDLLTAAVWANTASSFIPFANGGIVHAANGWVGGNSLSGDRVPAMLNSGELVLNRAQQGVLADALEGGNELQNLQLNAVIKGEQIRLVLNNNGRRTGRGEYVQTNRR